MLLLSDKFPVEFSSFLCGLQLSEAHESVAVDSKLDKITSSCRVKVKSGFFGKMTGLWSDKCDDGEKLSSASFFSFADKHSDPMTALYVPLQFAADLDFLAAIVRVSERLGSVEILDCDVVVYATRYYW